MEHVTSLSLSQKISFSLGHFYNDLTSAMWFTYSLIFFTGVVGISSVNAGYLLLLGQVVDAVSTPFIGYESDITNGFCGYSKRKSWHLMGTILVSISFCFFFLPVLGGSQSTDLGKVIYYSPFIIIFQIGWASVQISHMTMVSELTPNESQRVALNSYRNAMTLVAYVVVYGLVWLLFNRTKDAQWNSGDEYRFMILVIIIVIVGGTFSILFHVFTREDQSQYTLLDSSIQQREIMLWTDWFKEGQFYIVGLGYMGARLIMNISQTYWPFYIINSLRLSKKFAAIIPLIVYSSGFVTSLSMKKLNSIFGRKPTYLLGCLITAAALIWMALIKQSTAQLIYGPAIIIGCGSTVLLVTSLSMIGDMIGCHTSSGAFVYGIMSFVDKLSSGITLMLIQATQPQCSQSECPAINMFFKDVMAYVLAGFDVVCFLVFFALVPFTLGKLKKFNRHSEDSEEVRA